MSGESSQHADASHWRSEHARTKPIGERAAQWMSSATGMEEQTARDSVPYVAAGAVGLGGLLLAEPLGKVGKEAFNVVRNVVTGFGHLEKIPVIGGVFSGLGWTADRLGDVSGFLIGGAAAVMTFNLFKSPAAGLAPSEEASASNPLRTVGSRGSPPVSHAHNVQTPRDQVPRHTTALPVSPAPQPPVPTLPAGISLPTVDDSRPLSHLSEQIRSALQAGNEELSRHLQALAQHRVHHYESNVNFVTETTRFFTSADSSPSPANGLRTTLTTMGLTTGEAQWMVSPPGGGAPTPAQIDPYLDQVGWSLASLYRNIIRVPTGQASPSWIPVNQDNWDSLSITQKHNFLRAAVPLAQIRYQVITYPFSAQMSEDFLRGMHNGLPVGSMNPGRAGYSTSFNNPWLRHSTTLPGIRRRLESLEVRQVLNTTTASGSQHSEMLHAIAGGDAEAIMRQFVRCSEGAYIDTSRLPWIMPDGAARQYDGYFSDPEWRNTVCAGVLSNNRRQVSFNPHDETGTRFRSYAQDGSTSSIIIPVALELRHLAQLNGDRIGLSSLFRANGSHTPGSGLNAVRNGLAGLLQLIDRDIHNLTTRGQAGERWIRQHTEHMTFLSHNLALAREQGLTAVHYSDNHLVMRVLPSNHAPGAPIRPEDTRLVYLSGRWEGQRFIATGYARLPGNADYRTTPPQTMTSFAATLDFASRSGFSALLEPRPQDQVALTLSQNQVVVNATALVAPAVAAARVREDSILACSEVTSVPTHSPTTPAFALQNQTARPAVISC